MSSFSTVAQALQWYVRHRGADSPFYIFRDRHGGRQVFTLGRVHQLAGRCAAFLRKRGVTKNSRVVVCLANSPERMICDLGLLYAGAVCINGTHQMKDGSDIIHCLRQSRASVFLLDPDVTHNPWTPLQDLVQRNDDGSVTSEQLPDLRRVVFVQRQEGKDFLGCLEQASEWFMEDTVQDSDDCFVFTTSGSTGMPKLVAHPHRNFVCAMQQWAQGRVSLQAVRYQDTPLGTSGGNVTLALMNCETRVLCDARAGLPENRGAFITRCLLEENCTRAALSVSDLMSIHQLLTGEAFADGTNRGTFEYGSLLKRDLLEQVSLGGQPVTSQVVATALELAPTVMVYYGCTELGLLSVGLVSRKGGCCQDYVVGRPLPGIEVRVVDEGLGTALPVGQIGQVLVKHPNPFREYLHHPDETNPPSRQACFTADGYYCTGDRGKVDQEGYLSIFGRTGDSVIIRGPRVFYPHVLEAAVRTCPGVADVIIVGVPDPLLKEEFCACVALKDGASMKEVEEEVEKRCFGPSETLHSLRPRFYLRFDCLPQLMTGRPDRLRIKQMAREKLTGQ